MTSGTPVTSENETPNATEIDRQIERIAASQGFKNSDPIRNVFLFLAKHSLECPGQAVKEHQIATSALGRSTDFDPRIDSAVRVVVTRLRARLAEYYTHEGLNDKIVADLPKGAYILSFNFRLGSLMRTLSPTPKEAALGDLAADKRGRNAVALRQWLAILAASLALAVACFFAGRTSAVPTKPAILATFWDGFLKSGDPLIVFSNPIFEGTPERGMRLLDPSAFHIEGTNDTFTGTGEVIAVQMLTAELARLGHGTRIKRARLFTWDEALANSLIIVGGPAQSSVFTQLPRLQKFVLKSPIEEPYRGEEAVRNEKPVHEQAYFLPSRHGDSGTEYAIVALTQGASSEHENLMVAGTNTFGTEAAARAVCNVPLLTKLLRQLDVRSSRSAVPLFEALFKVEIRGGTPLEPQLLQVYKRQPNF